MNPKRLKELTGMLMIGDGLLAVVAPRGHVGLWRTGPRPFRRMVRALLAHPAATRAVGAAEAAIGYWLAERQFAELG